MAGATLTTYDAALKEDYQPGIRGQLNEEIMMLAQVDKNTEDFEGRRAVLSLHTARNSGVGARAEGGTLPSAGNQSYAEERINVRGQYGRIQLSGWVMDGSRSNAGSFARAMQQESDRLVNDLKRDVNRQVFGTSDGKIATCGTTAGTTTVQLAATTSLVQMQQFHQNMVVDIGTLAEAVAGTAQQRTISGIDETNLTLTVDSNTTTDGNDFVFVSGSGGATTNQKELTGLQTIVAASGTLFNVDPTTDLTWVSFVDSNSGTNRALSESLVNKTLQRAYRKSGVYADFIVTEDGVYRSYENLLLSAKRFTNTTTLNGGHEALTVNAGTGKVNVVWDKDCPANAMFMLRLANLVEFVYEDWGWMDEDGAILSRVSNQHAYEGTFYKLHELATDKRNAHALLDDITAA